MDIFTKDLSEKTVVINKHLSLLVDYPSVEQKFKLDRAVSKGLQKNIPLKEVNGKMDIDWDNMPPELFSEMTAAEKYRKALFLKYTIKGWKGNLFKGEENNCVLEDGELCDKQWNAICYDENTVKALYDSIINILEFNETDKKKSISTAGSKLKVGLEGKG